MPNKDKYLSNTDAKFGPSELAGFLPGARALILGRSIDLSTVPDITSYFSIIIAEDPAYAVGLQESPDITFWQQGSPYVGGVYSFPGSRSTLYMVNRQALKQISDAGIDTSTFNLCYLPGGTVGPQPSVVKYLAIGLDPLAPGQHLAAIMGATEFYDTEGRSGTILATSNSILSAVNNVNGYGLSAFFLAQRYGLVDRI